MESVWQCQEKISQPRFREVLEIFYLFGINVARDLSFLRLFGCSEFWLYNRRFGRMFLSSHVGDSESFDCCSRIRARVKQILLFAEQSYCLEIYV
jgi:hypothetical protein